MALDVASSLPLAALVACSGYPHPGWNPKPAVPILLTHGDQDPVVPVAASEALEEQLRAAGGTVRRVGFAGGHGIDPSLLGIIREFLEAGWRSPVRQPVETDPISRPIKSP
jgi:phospholipase/carboxylesterase